MNTKDKIWKRLLSRNTQDAKNAQIQRSLHPKIPVSLRVKLVFLFCGALITPLNAHAAAPEKASSSSIHQQHPWKISWGWHYFEGDYRLMESTRVFYVPWKIQYRLNRTWQVAFTAPWLAVFGPGTASADTILSPTDNVSSKDASGLGDVIVNLEYLSPKQWIPGWWHNLSISQKIPTADTEKGLGNGAPDTSFHLTFFKTTERWQWLVDTAYKKRSDHSLDNTFNGSIGALFRPMIKEPWYSGLIATFREPATSVGSLTQEWSFYNTYQINASWSTSAYFTVGTTTDSLDSGFGGQMTYRF